MKKVVFMAGKEVLDLPAETQAVYRCQLGPRGLKVYRELEYRFKSGIQDKTITASNALVKALRLAQLSGGWLKADDGTEERIDTSKLDLLYDILQDIGTEPVVVFGRFHSDLDAIHAAAKRAGLPSAELSGRKNDLTLWKDGGSQVLAVQAQAGGEAIDLTRARYCIFYSLSFSLGEYDQARSRVHRPGQTQPVEYIHLQADNTIDQVIMKALENRADVVGSILEELK
jgi:SNF2 family DNA or RNA helicase